MSLIRKLWKLSNEVSRACDTRYLHELLAKELKMLKEKKITAQQCFENAYARMDEGVLMCKWVIQHCYPSPRLLLLAPKRARAR
jgi:hypothetical protein